VQASGSDASCIEVEDDVYAAELLQLDSSIMRMQKESESEREIESDREIEREREIMNQSGCPSSPVHLETFEAEFGWETMIAVPHAYWLHHTCGGKLASTQSCGDTRAWYWFSPKHFNHMDCLVRKGIIQLHPPHEWHGVSKFTVLMGLSTPMWTPPPHKAYYSQKSSIAWPRRRSDSPSIMILNKFHAPDTFKAPFLHLVLSTIHELCPETEVLYHRDFSVLHSDTRRDLKNSIGSLEAEIVMQTKNPLFPKYLRQHDEALNSTGWDWEWIEQYPFVQGSREAFNRNKLESGEYNDFLMGAMSHHNCFVSLQGGLQASSAWFGGKQVVRNIDNSQEIMFNFYEGGAPTFAGGQFSVVREKDEAHYIHSLKDQLLRDQCKACSLS